MWLWVLEADQSEEEHDRDGRAHRRSGIAGAQTASPDRVRARPRSWRSNRELVSAMVHSAIVRIVDFSARNRWTVVIAGALLMLGAAAFDAARFLINTDIEGLISQNLPWRQRELELSKAFPKKAFWLW